MAAGPGGLATKRKNMDFGVFTKFRPEVVQKSCEYRWAKKKTAGIFGGLLSGYSHLSNG
jgi:hypothetical protein